MIKFLDAGVNGECHPENAEVKADENRSAQVTYSGFIHYLGNTDTAVLRAEVAAKAADTLDYGSAHKLPVTVTRAKPGSIVRFMQAEGITSALTDQVIASEEDTAGTTYSGVTDYSSRNFTLEVEYTSDLNGGKKRLSHQVRMNVLELQIDISNGISAITNPTQHIEFLL